MSKSQVVGALILIVCVVLILGYIGLLFFYDPHIKSIVDLGAAGDTQYWLIATPVLVAFVGVLFIGAWIGWTMASIPPPKPIEEITTETVDKTQ